MKPSYYGKMPEKAFMHKEAKSMAVFKAFKNRVQSCLGKCCRLQTESLCELAQQKITAFVLIKEPVLSVYCRSNKKHTSSSCKMPGKWRNTVWRTTYHSRFLLLLTMVPNILLFLVTFISITDLCVFL